MYRFHNNPMMPCACACFMVQRPQQFFLLITVLLLRYSAAGWPGLSPLRPYLDFGATGAPTFNLGVYWDTWGFSPSPSPCPRPLQSLGLHYGGIRQLCHVWPRIQPWGPLILFSLASIPDYLTGEYPEDYGLDTEGLAAPSCRQVELCRRPWFPWHLISLTSFSVCSWVDFLTSGEWNIIIMRLFHTCVHFCIMACHGP